MESCKWTPRLSAYFDGEVSELDAAEVRAHLFDCSTCGATFARWSSMRDDLQLLQPTATEIPHDLEARIFDRFERTLARESRQLHRGLRIWSMAAGLLCLVGASLLFGNRLLWSPGVAARSPQEIEHALNEILARSAPPPPKAEPESHDPVESVDRVRK